MPKTDKLILTLANEILDLIQPFVDKDWILARNQAMIIDCMDELTIIKQDNELIACAGLKVYNNNYGEIYLLAINEQYQYQGHSKKLLLTLLEKTKQEKLTHLFAFSKYQENWFLKQGFSIASISDIPLEKQQNIDKKRNSNMFIIPVSRLKLLLDPS